MTLRRYCGHALRVLLLAAAIPCASAAVPEPADKCDESKSGQEVRVPYAADYYFYKRK